MKNTTNSDTNNTLAAIQLSQVIEQLKQDDNNLLQAYSEYVSDNDYDSVYYNDDENINAVFFADTHDALRSAFYGDYNPSHAYFTFNGYGNLQSFEYLDSDSSPIDVEELAQWLIDEDKLSDYDITVTTVGDKYNAILDHVSDIDSVASIQSLLSYLAVEFMYTSEWLSLSKNNTIDNYIERYIDVIIVHFIDKKDSEQLDGLLEYFGIEL